MKNPLTFLLIHPEMTRSKYTFAGIIEDESVSTELTFNLEASATQID